MLAKATDSCNFTLPQTPEKVLENKPDLSPSLARSELFLCSWCGT